MSAPQARRALVVAALLTVYIVWGSTYLAIRIAIESLPPFLMAALRFLAAGGIVVAVMLLRRYRASAQDVRRAGVAGVFLLLGGNGLVVWSEQFVSSGIAALIVSTVPLWIAVLDALYRRERPKTAVLLGLVVGFGGVAYLFNPRPGSLDRINPVAAGALVVATFLWAVGSLYSRYRPAASSAWMTTGLQMLC